jgi:hypothetical protein
MTPALSIRRVRFMEKPGRFGYVGDNDEFGMFRQSTNDRAGISMDWEGRRRNTYFFECE